MGFDIDQYLEEVSKTKIVDPLLNYKDAYIYMFWSLVGFLEDKKYFQMEDVKQIIETAEEIVIGEGEQEMAQTIKKVGASVWVQMPIQKTDEKDETGVYFAPIQKMFEERDLYMNDSHNSYNK